MAAAVKFAVLCCAVLGASAAKLPGHARRGYSYQPPTTPAPPPTYYTPVQQSYLPPQQSYEPPQQSYVPPPQPPKPAYSAPAPSYSPPEKPMPFGYGYGVNDEYNGVDFGHRTNSDGKFTTGEYSVLLPDGRKQIVVYTVDDNGYNADVKYEGEARPYEAPQPAYQPQPSYSSHSVQQPSQPSYSSQSVQQPSGSYLPPKTPDTLYRANF